MQSITKPLALLNASTAPPKNAPPKSHSASPDCPVCGFPAGQPGYLRADVEPGHPQFGKPQPCPRCWQENMSRRAENKSQLTGWLKDATLANFRARNENRAALSAVRAFVDDPRAWLTLWGEYGNGKSHLLGAVVNACSEADIPAAYYTLPDLLDQVRESFDGYYSPFMQRLRDLPVLAIDEIDKANLTPWAEEKIYQLVDARYRAIGSCGTVLAMNADPANAGSNSAAYIFSRMFDERSKVVELRGPDARPMAKRLWSALRMAA